MSSFSHLSATSYNSNNGNPKKHWRGPALFDSAIWEAARRFAGITHRRIRRRRAPPGSWCCGKAQTCRETLPGNLSPWSEDDLSDHPEHPALVTHFVLQGAKLRACDIRGGIR